MQHFSMPHETSSYVRFDHDQFARSKSPDDFWGQIRRTVNGKPVSDEQIQMIVGEIKQRLSLQPTDVLLDLACGNGALSRFLFDSCSESLGVDLSEYLISVANQHFARPPQYTFIAHDAAEYVRSESRPERFTKALCYGSFSYFPAAADVLRALREKFINIKTVFIGNLPDRDLKDIFYSKAKPDPAELSDHSSQIGIWRSREEFTALARNAGWNIQFSTMPAGFYSAHYRYDVTLSRP
jgi:SAM-dependent methyltransferase